MVLKNLKKNSSQKEIFNSEQSYFICESAMASVIGGDEDESVHYQSLWSLYLVTDPMKGVLTTENSDPTLNTMQ